MLGVSWYLKTLLLVSNSSDPKRRGISCYRSPTVKGSRIQNSTSPTRDANEQPSVVHLAGRGGPDVSAWRRKRTERRRIFRFYLSLDAKWVADLPPPLEHVLTDKNTMCSAF